MRRSIKLIALSRLPACSSQEVLMPTMRKLMQTQLKRKTMNIKLINNLGALSSFIDNLR